MSATIIFLLTPEPGEVPHRFRERFDEWRNGTDRLPQYPPRGFPREVLRGHPGHNPPRLFDEGVFKAGSV